MAKTAELEEFRLTSSHEHTKITTIYRATGYERSFPGGFTVKNMPDNVGDMGSFLGWDDPGAKEMATLSWKRIALAVHSIMKELDMT